MGGGNDNSHPIIFLSIIYSNRHWWGTNIDTGIQWGHTGVLEANDAVLESGTLAGHVSAAPAFFTSYCLLSPHPSPTTKVKVRILRFTPWPALADTIFPSNRHIPFYSSNWAQWEVNAGNPGVTRGWCQWVGHVSHQDHLGVAWPQGSPWTKALYPPGSMCSLLIPSLPCIN